MLWTNNDRTAFYLIPHNVQVAPGELLLSNLKGRTCKVNPPDAAAFIVDESAANDIVQAQIGKFRRSTLSPATVKAIVEPIIDAMNPLLDEQSTSTARGRARLERVARAVRDRGGPDWTADPESLPGRLRDALSDPALAPALGSLVESIREASRQARADRDESDPE
ncbi:MAG: hypothetical protein ACI9MC_003917 [Kiritimatiellia bacterium]|jgi:hypothetical protein